MSIVLDSGAVTFFAAPTGRSDALLAELRKRGPLFVPSMVLVESLTGRPVDAITNRFLKTCLIGEVVPIPVARLAARLRGVARTGSAVDALVVAFAQAGTVVTGDQADITALAAHAHDVTVITI